MALTNGSARTPGLGAYPDLSRPVRPYTHGMTVDIFQAPTGNFSNGGVSTRVHHLTVIQVMDLTLPVGARLSPVPVGCRVFSPREGHPAATLMVRRRGGEVLLHVVPVLPDREPTRAMMGGCYVATSDSRWARLLESLLGHGFYGAVPLHDRYKD